VDLRVAAADLLPPAERFVFARLVVVLPRLAVAFFVVERLLCLRGFSVVPITASAMALAALDTPSIAASMLVLAVSAIVPKTPSFSLSMPFTSFRCIRAVYPRLTLSLGRGQSLTMTKLCRVRALSASADLKLGRAAFAEAVRQRPAQRILLRHKSRVIEEYNQ
jgi:hypothetical protein